MGGVWMGKKASFSFISDDRERPETKKYLPHQHRRLNRLTVFRSEGGKVAGEACQIFPASTRLPQNIADKLEKSVAPSPPPLR